MCCVKPGGCSDPPGPHGSPQAVASFGSSPGLSLFKSQKFTLEKETKLKAFHRYRQGDLIMIKQVIMPILVVIEPGLYIFNSCRQFIRTVPTLTRDNRDPDDVDSNAEDHIVDETRYRLMATKKELTVMKLSGL